MTNDTARSTLNLTNCTRNQSSQAYLHRPLHLFYIMHSLDHEPRKRETQAEAIFPDFGLNGESRQLPT